MNPGFIISLAVLGVFLAWLMGIGKRKPVPAPEDDVDTPIDEAELDAAERDVRNDPTARPAADAVDDDEDDWGPGSGHSPMPGVL